MSRRSVTGVLCGLVVVAAALRFGTLGAKGFWGDELSTVNLVHRPLGDMFHGIARLESTPPLFYLLEWAWAQVAPTTEFSMRFLPALCGVALVPVTWGAAREVVSDRAALLAAGLVAVNPLLVWYSQDARSYSLLALLTAIGLWLFLRARREQTAAAYAGWAVFSSLALATHYFAVFLVVPEAVMLLRSARARRAPALAVAGIAAAGAALLPLALHQRSLGHADWIGHTPLPSRLIATPAQFLVGFDAPVLVPVVILAFAAAIVGLRLLASRPPSDRQPSAGLVVRLAALGIAVPFGLALLGVDYFFPRNLIGALVPALIALAAGFAGPVRARHGTVAAAALCTLSLAVVVLTASEPKFHSENWRAAASELGPAKIDRVLVVTPGQAGRKPIEFYLPGSRKLRPRGRPVSEVVLLSLPRQGSTWPSPPPPLPALSRMGFHLVAREREDRFALWRYRADSPVWLAPGELAAAGRSPTSPAVMWQSSVRTIQNASAAVSTWRTP
jgi:4-amino-4-deoxy-L-arabinose transferase-like glycosyltransferase